MKHMKCLLLFVFLGLASPVIPAEHKKKGSWARSMRNFLMPVLSDRNKKNWRELIDYVEDNPDEPPADEAHESTQTSDNAPCTFADIAGGVPQEITNLLDMLRNEEKYKLFGVTPPKGTLLVGPPGCGKTLIARALACESGCSFLYTNATEFVAIYSGNGPLRIRNLFDHARYLSQLNHGKKVIIFIDELDAIGNRATLSENDSESKRTLNELLNQMDGFDSCKDIIVLGATNNPKDLDPALKRAGRFDTIVEIPLPDKTRREAVLRHYITKSPFNGTTPSISYDQLAEKSRGFNNADLKELVRLASYAAAQENSPTLTQEHLENALEKIKQQKHYETSDQRPAHEPSPSTAPSCTFSDIAGGVPQEIVELLDMLHNEEKYKKFGITPPRGILLVGPPGCGKTLLARALAGESGCEFCYASATEFVEIFSGTGPAHIRELFDKARTLIQVDKKKKIIIFIDELDAIGNRSTLAGHDTESHRTLNELLNQMDGFASCKDIIVLGATNNPKDLDPALKRAGRFDTIVEIPLPDKARREAVLRHYIYKVPTSSLDPHILYDQLAEKSAGFNNADLKELVRLASYAAAHENAPQLTHQHLDTALEKIRKQKRFS